MPVRRLRPRLSAALKAALAAALFAAAALPALPAAASGPRFQDMTPGRYEVLLDGLLCRTCVRFVVEEAASLKEVEKASGDFDQETLFIVVRPNTTLKAAKLQKALRRAAKRADLGTRFQIRSIRYRIVGVVR